MYRLSGIIRVNAHTHRETRKERKKEGKPLPTNGRFSGQIVGSLVMAEYEI